MKVAYGFGTKAQPIPPFCPDWQEKRARWKQVHGAAIAEVRSLRQECGEVDAFFTLAPRVPIGVFTADCVPVLLARRNGRAVAAAHAGWRGTRAHVVKRLWETLGESPSDWVAMIGPAIRSCCYEVSDEIAADFAREFTIPHNRMLDLQSINEQELRGLGIGEIEVVRECTRCTLEADGSFKYNSYRREGSGTRQYSVIEIQA